MLHLISSCVKLLHIQLYVKAGTWNEGIKITNQASLHHNPQHHSGNKDNERMCQPVHVDKTGLVLCFIVGHPGIHGLDLRSRMRETMGHFPSNPSPPSTGRTLKGPTSSKKGPIVFPPCPATFPWPLMVYLFNSGGVPLRHNPFTQKWMAM